jgi:transcriptional regulator with XRE-family HTH domain
MTMERRPEFGRRFRALMGEETQEEVARRLGCSQPTVSRMARDVPPGPRLLERLVEKYGLDRAEWEALAGYAPPESEEERLARVALQAAEAVLRQAALAQNGAVRLVEGLRELSRKYGRPVPVDLSGGTESGRGLTAEEAEAILEDLERQLQAGLI